MQGVVEGACIAKQGNPFLSSCQGDVRLCEKADSVILSEAKNPFLAGRAPHFVRQDPSPTAQEDIFTQSDVQLDSFTATAAGFTTATAARFTTDSFIARIRRKASD